MWWEEATIASLGVDGTFNLEGPLTKDPEKIQGAKYMNDVLPWLKEIKSLKLLIKVRFEELGIFKMLSTRKVIPFCGSQELS